MALSFITLTHLLKGKRGKSAYEVAVDEGFTGTKAEWLASLEEGSVKKIDGIAPDSNKNIQMTYTYETETAFEADKNNIPVGAIVVKKWLYPPLSPSSNWDYVLNEEKPVLNPDGTQKKWLDGKPIFRKCWLGTFPEDIEAKKTKGIILTVSSLGTIIGYGGSWEDQDSIPWRLPIPFSWFKNQELDTIQSFYLAYIHKKSSTNIEFSTCTLNARTTTHRYAIWVEFTKET
jgi:hypothetical protein